MFVTPSAQTVPIVPRDVPFFETLTREESEAVLSRNSVGRIAFALHDRVDIVPIHYVYLDGWVYGRTASTGRLRDILRNRRVVFEVDEHSELFEWRSVIVRGSLYVIQTDGTQRSRSIYRTALSLMRGLVPESLTEADPVAFRDQLFRIRAAEISGRCSAPTGGKIRLPHKADTLADGAHPDMDAKLLDETTKAIAGLNMSATSRIQVEALDGVVVLSGTVETPADRHSLEGAVLDLPDVLAVVQELETSIPRRLESAPVELARAAFYELLQPPTLAGTGIKIVIEHGWVRLEGTVPRLIRDEVIRRVGRVKGARGVIDRLHVIDSQTARAAAN